MLSVRRIDRGEIYFHRIFKATLRLLAAWTNDTRKSSLKPLSRESSSEISWSNFYGNGLDISHATSSRSCRVVETREKVASLGDGRSLVFSVFV